jgi:transcriptional regulator with XRE-family HTH domain
LSVYRFDPEALKRLRLGAGLKREQLALDLDVTKEAVTAWETGRTIPRSRTLLRLAERLGTEPAALLAVDSDALPVSEQAREASFAARRAQGLPDLIEDAAALDEGAQLLRPNP